jgi:hypothetical protein
MCSEKVSKYKINFSSSHSGHGIIYTYTVLGGNANSFRVKNCPETFLDGTNIKFTLSALSAIDELIISPVETELDTSSAGTSCEDIGVGNLASAIAFDSISVVQNPPKPPPPPTDCTGGTWGDWGPCIKDGLEVTECGKYGIKTRKLTGYTPAANGGKCTTEESEACYTFACPADPPMAAQDCVLSKDWYDLPIEDGKPLCSKTCGGGVKTQKRLVEVSAAYGGKCDIVTREVACNTQVCPVDCVGSWIPNGAPYKTKNPTCGSKGAGVKPEIYNITVNRQGTGRACPHTHGETRLTPYTIAASRCH